MLFPETLPIPDAVLAIARKLEETLVNPASLVWMLTP